MYIIMLIGILLALITWWQSPYQFPQIIKRLYYGTQCIMLCLLVMLCFLDYSFVSHIAIIPILVGILANWVLVFIWYIHYFYKKSQDGYRLVWLKVLLFSLFPLLPLFYYHVNKVDHTIRSIGVTMGDTIGDPVDYGYPENNF